MSLTTTELTLLKEEIGERDDQIDFLNAFISRDPELLSPCLIVHGYKAVGKTLTVQRFLDTLGATYTHVSCDQCVSKKMLLRRCFDGIRVDSGHVNKREIGTRSDFQMYGAQGDTFASFISAMEKFTDKHKYTQHHVLVLDRVDECFEYLGDVLAAFTRLREASTKLKNLSVVAIISGDDPKEIVTLSNPHVHFRPYSEEEIVRILQAKKLCRFGGDGDGDTTDFYNQYVKAVVDLFYHYTGSDISLLSDVIQRLWEPFVEPIEEGRLKATEFVKVLKENIDLFTHDGVVSNSGVVEFKTLQMEQELTNTTGGHVHDLPLHSKFLLLASYLASYCPPRDDILKYSKIKVAKYKKRATKASKVGRHGAGHLGKGDIDTRMLTANFSDLERILAILSVIYRSYAPSLNKSDKDDLLYMDEEIISNEEKKAVEKSKFTLTRNIDLTSQIATLFSLGLLSKTTSSDILAAKVRWRCNIDWHTAESLAKSLSFPIEEFLMDE
ncbi:Origin recognition complex subunit 5 [Candida viswanathii]|uniref:Origin recognition complex subunit 5 n=1 Tax=Candida viswanathii TaxID=5486 RepID=A0A367Y0E7_9ASCO|nr:Origin recognition complex subunit 5 [Candida viswanathii]